VAEPVVDLFEIVEVDEDQHEWADADRLIEALGEEQPVGQLRQRVVVYLMREPALHVVQALGQLSMRTDGDHLSNRDEQHQHNRAAELNPVESLSDVEVEAVQHRHSEEPDIGQRELHPFDGVASALGRRLPRQVQHRVGDQELAENEPDASPELTALQADGSQVDDHPVRRRDHHHSAGQQEVIRPISAVASVRDRGQRRGDHHHEFEQRVDDQHGLIV
jgi:hypothetical protein